MTNIVTFKEYLKESAGNVLLTYGKFKVFMNTENAINTKDHVHDRLLSRSNLDLPTFKEKFKKVLDKVSENGIYVAELELSKIQVVFSVKNRTVVIFTILDGNMKPKNYDHKLSLLENSILNLLDGVLNENECDFINLNFEDHIIVGNYNGEIIFENVVFL